MAAIPYSRPTLTALRQQALTDIQSASFNGNGTALLQKSILRVVAAVEAGMVYELFGFLDWISLQAVPVTADHEFLEAWANLKAVYRLDATAATGVASFTGTGNTLIPAGTVLTRDDGVRYTTDADWQLLSNLPLSFTAVTAGADGNAASGIALTLAAPIAGVNSAGSASQAIVGGADQETDDSLRARMLQVYANPPAGGSANDFVTWALQVPGVTRAWAVPQGIGAGSVLLYVMFDTTEAAFLGFPQGSNGGASQESRITPATGDQLLVANHLYPLRPVTSVVQVNAPLPANINFQIQSLQLANATVEAAIVAALKDCFTRLGSPIAGSAIYPSDLNAAIESVAGVQRYTLVSPVAPVVVPNGSLPVVGQVTFL